MNNVEWASVENLASDETLTEERSRRISLLRNVARLLLISSSVLLVSCFIALFYVPGFPLYLVVVDVITMFAMLIILGLLGRGHIKLALPLSIASMTTIMFMVMYILDGARGPAILLSPLIMMIAGIIGERRYSQPTITIHGVLYIAFVILEALGVLTPYQMPELVSRIAWIVIFVVAAAMLVMINRRFIASQGLALSASQKREEALAQMSRQAQEAADAQRAAQAQALARAHQLQEVAQEYVTFLERIASGDYSASLDLSTLAEQPNLPQELITLGEYINTTVASLVAALDEAQSAQRTYTRQSWEGLMEAERVPGGYRYRAGEAEEPSQVEVDETAWLPQMTRTVHSKDVTVETQALALPIASGTRAQLIGALGVRREQDEPWSEDELALVTTVTDQLAQTLENLRLLDETTRRAAREQMAGEITGRIREAVEIEAVLERALSELGRALAAERGTAYLSLSEQEEV
ncbi:MAG: GAF domain-containing protein [Anaerolineae bacterium]